MSVTPRPTSASRRPNLTIQTPLQYWPPSSPNSNGVFSVPIVGAGALGGALSVSGHGAAFSTRPYSPRIIASQAATHVSKGRVASPRPAPQRPNSVMRVSRSHTPATPETPSSATSTTSTTGHFPPPSTPITSSHSQHLLGETPRVYQPDTPEMERRDTDAIIQSIINEPMSLDDSLGESSHPLVTAYKETTIHISEEPSTSTGEVDLTGTMEQPMLLSPRGEVAHRARPQSAKSDLVPRLSTTSSQQQQQQQQQENVRVVIKQQRPLSARPAPLLNISSLRDSSAIETPRKRPVSAGPQRASSHSHVPSEIRNALFFEETPITWGSGFVARSSPSQRKPPAAVTQRRSLRPWSATARLSEPPQTPHSFPSKSPRQPVWPAAYKSVTTQRTMGDVIASMMSVTGPKVMGQSLSLRAKNERPATTGGTRTVFSSLNMNADLDSRWPSNSVSGGGYESGRMTDRSTGRSRAHSPDHGMYSHRDYPPQQYQQQQQQQEAHIYVEGATPRQHTMPQRPQSASAAGRRGPSRAAQLQRRASAIEEPSPRDILATKLNRIVTDLLEPTLATRLKALDRVTELCASERDFQELLRETGGMNVLVSRLLSVHLPTSTIEPRSPRQRSSAQPTRLAEVRSLLTALGAACDKSPSNRAALRTQHGIEKIVGLLGGSTHYSAALLSVIHLFCEGDYENQTEFRLNGGIEKLTELLRTASDSEVQVLAAAAVTSLCQENLDNLQCFVDCSGVVALLKLAQDRDSRTSHTAVLSLGFLCMQDSGVRSLIFKNNGIVAIVALLRTSPTERFINAIAEIVDAHPDNQHEMRRQGAFPLLINVLDIEDNVLRQKTLVAIATLCNANEDNMKAFGSLGLISKLCILLKVHETRNLAAMALATCADHVPTNQQAATICIPVLVEMLGGPPGDALRGVYACSALRALSIGNRINQETVRDAGGLIKLIMQLSATTDVMMRAIAITTLIDLCVDNPGNLRICRENLDVRILQGIASEMEQGSRERQQTSALLQLLYGDSSRSVD